MTNGRFPFDYIDRWAGHGLPLSASNRLSSDDLDLVHAHMCGMFMPHRLAIEGATQPRIAFRHNQASLCSLTFNATDYGNSEGRIVIDIPPMDDVYLVQFPLSGRAEISHGGNSHVVRPGELCVLPPGVAIRQNFEPGFKHFTMKVPKQELDLLLDEELGSAGGELWFATRPTAITGRAGSLARMIRTLCDELDSGDTACAHPRVQRALETMVGRLLLLAIPHNFQERLDSRQGAAAPFYVRRVEDFIHAHGESAVTLTDLIAASGVSGRALHAGFRKYRDTTPIAYLRDYRLRLAREALTARDASARSVTDVALACGFTHLSRFAQAYADRFGEKPSDTLKAAHSHN